jgi:isopentenyl-diphosphate delta-isomerase
MPIESIWSPEHMGLRAEIPLVAGFVLVNPRGDVLVVSQQGKSWSLPKGHVEEGEETINAAMRELAEESGITECDFVGVFEPYVRGTIRADGTIDDKAIKRVQMFLGRTDANQLAPRDPENPVALWLTLAKAVDLLTHSADKEFLTLAWERIRTAWTRRGIRLCQLKKGADERIDILNEDGEFTGQVEEKRNAHAQGAWHRSVHLWIFERNPNVYVWLQRRAAKRISPFQFDAPVGGHVSHGEKPIDALLREMNEELGPALIDTIPQWLGSVCTEMNENGVINREHVELFIAEATCLVEAADIDEREVAGLYRVALDDLSALIAGKVDHVSLVGITVCDGEQRIEQVLAHREEIIPAQHPGYWPLLIKGIDQKLQDL